MGLLTETLPNLALARPGLDRHAERRAEPDLIDRLLADPATRVLEVHGDKAPVVLVQLDSVDGSAGEPTLDLRPPVPADANGLVLFLGQDGDGTAYLAVARPAPAEEATPDERLRGCARSAPTSPTAMPRCLRPPSPSPTGTRPTATARGAALPPCRSGRAGSSL